jgi:hypothetical protein
LDVSEETAERWAELHRQGWPFTRIARETGVDRRTIARIVRQWAANQVGDAVAHARGEVAARMLQGHLIDVETVATLLVRIVLPPSMRGSLYLEGDAVEAVLQEAVTQWWVLRRTVRAPGVAPDDLDWRRGRRQAEALVLALREHEPTAWPLVEEWERNAGKYRRLWLELEKKAEAAGFHEEAARSALEAMLRGPMGEGAPPQAGPAEGAAASPPEMEPVERWLRAGEEAKETIAELRRALEAMEQNFQALEEMLDHAPLQQALLRSRCRHCPA